MLYIVNKKLLVHANLSCFATRLAAELLIVGVVTAEVCLNNKLAVGVEWLIDTAGRKGEVCAGKVLFDTR